MSSSSSDLSTINRRRQTTNGGFCGDDFKQEENNMQCITYNTQKQSIKNKIHLSNNQSSAYCLKRIQRKLKRCQKLTIVIIFSWLLLNTESVYSRMRYGAKVATRLLSKSLLNNNDLLPTKSSGLSTIEAITLIQAMNSNNHNSLNTQLALSSLNPQLRQQLDSTGLMQRQLPVPVPAPVPFPLPFPVVLLAAVAAFIAAVAAGLTPFAAVAAAFVAVFAAIIAALLAIIKVPQNKAGNPLIKKLVIKKTVLPFVIPIPYKKKEKEIVYVHKEHHHHKKHEHEHEYEHKHKKKYKSKKKMDVGQENIEENIIDEETNGIGHNNNDNSKFKPIRVRRKEMNHLDKIENLLNEQDKIQGLVDKIVDS